jgi:hypothetical protein
MDAQETNKPETAEKNPDALPASDVAAPAAPEVSNTHFEDMVREAIEGVGGTLLFKMKVGDNDDAYHAAAAAVGDGDGRNFLLLTLPARGGQLKVETTAQSDDPLAGIAESYAGLMDVLKVAA